MSYENLIMYGAVIPSDGSEDKKEKNDQRGYEVSDPKGWAQVLKAAKKMK